MRTIGVLLVFLIACKPVSKSITQNENLLQKIISREIGENATVTKNDSNTFALAVLSNDESVHYGVIRLSDNKMVFKNIIRGTIKWDGDLKLAESLKPGIVKKDSKSGDYSRTIDLGQFVTQRH